MEAGLTLFALSLVVVGALIHATWNLLAKHSRGGVHFVWAYSVVSAVLYLPLAMWALLAGGMKWTLPAIVAILATGGLHVGYSLVLQGGYKRAGLSVVYPVARGTGPALSVIGAILILGEPVTFASAAGALLVIGGVFIIGFARDRASGIPIWPGIKWGALTGIFIAAYTLNDGAAVRLLALSPILVDYFGTVFRIFVLAPVVLRDRERLRAEWRRTAKYAVGIGALIPIPYILALYAMKLTSVSFVAPARELSMLVGVLLGWRFLDEEDVTQRFVGATLIAAGVVALSFS
jgi:drug/metabolite transporter (DMT)-like permease